MADLPRLYVIPLQAHEAIGLKVAEVCWGSCGHGLIGGMTFDNDAGIPCDQPADRCPAFDKEASEPSGTVNDGIRAERPVYLRKLKAPWRVIKPPLPERLRALRWKIGGPRAWLYRLRERLNPGCKECGWSLKEHQPKPEPYGRVYMKREWGYGIDHIRASGDGVLFEVAAVHCTGKVESVLLTNSDVEALRDALNEYLEAAQ